MTLKEKFIDAFKSGKRFDIQNAETIADEFAVEFEDWCMNLINKYGILEYKRNYANKTSKELLEIFKKEKGL